MAARALWQPIDPALAQLHAAFPLLFDALAQLFGFPPLFLYLASAAQHLGADLLRSVRLVGAILGAGITPAIYGLLSEVCGQRLATAGALLCLLLYPLNVFCALGRPETAHLLCFLVGSLFLLRWTRENRDWQMVAAAASLGLSVWFKEIGVAYLLTATLYLLVTTLRGHERRPYRGIAWFLAVLAVAVMPLVILARMEQAELFLEVSSAKPWNLNMQSLPLFTSARIILVNVATMLGVPPSGRYVTGPLCLISCTYLLLRGLVRRSPFATLVCSYLLIAIPFFTWFPQKYDYYLLPASLLLGLCAACEIFDVSAGSVEGVRRPLFKGSLGRADSFAAVVGGCVLGGLLVVNAVQDRGLFFSRGPYDYLRQFVAACTPGERIVGFPSLHLNWLAETSGRKIVFLPLFVDQRYTINWPAVNDATTDAIAIDVFYVEGLSQRFPSEWSAIERLFPRHERFASLVVLRR